MVTKGLGLPADPRAAVFRALVTKLRNDPILKNAVGDWFVWDGSKDDEAEFGTGGGIQIRLTPRIGPGSWADESGMEFPLLVDIEALIPGTNADDFMGLQMAIEIALYTPSDTDKARAFSTYLMSIGAMDGIVDFMPLNDADAQTRKDGVWGLRGQFKIDVRRTINP